MVNDVQNRGIANSALRTLGGNKLNRSSDLEGHAPCAPSLLFSRHPPPPPRHPLQRAPWFLMPRQLKLLPAALVPRGECLVL